VLLVALTGYGAEEDKRRSREAGFHRHLVKPAEPSELRIALAAPVAEDGTALRTPRDRRRPK
jgi:CheY-like chemotaxis protein